MTAKKARGGRPTPEQLEKRKARVLDVARKLFLARGFAGTPVAEIARLSRVSPRLITGHFGDKANIFTEIFKQTNERAFTIATETKEVDTLEEILFRAAQFAWTIFYSPNAISFLRMIIGEGERMSGMTSDIAEKSAVHFYEEVASIFDDLISRNMIASQDTKKLAKYFADLVIGLSVVQAGMGYWGKVPDDAELRDKVAFFCCAVQDGRYAIIDAADVGAVASA